MKIYLRSLTFLLFFVASFAGMAQKLYWVGGSGNFNDPAHWSYQSNGTGGAKTPTLTDDVTFDENSFKSQSVISIIGGANCHDIIFADYTAPLILSGTQNEKLTISGDVKFNPYVDNQFLGEIHLTASQSNTSVLFSTSKIKGNLFFDGNTTWDLETLLGSDNSVFNLNNGKINLNHASIYTGTILVKNNVSIEGQQSVLSAKNKLWVNNTASFIDHGIYIQAPLNDPAKFNLGNNHVAANRMANNDNSTLACSFTYTVVSQPQCVNSCDGIVSFTIPTCGTTPYTATWIPGSGSCSAPPGTPATVVPGIYTQNNICGCSALYNIIFADDIGNFIGSTSVSMTAPSAITIIPSSIQPTCNGVCNGKVKTIVIGGTQPYSIQWTPGPTHSNNFGSDSITGLCAPSSYTISVTDNHSCVNSATVSLSQPTVISPNGSAKAPLCAGVCNGLAYVAPTGGTPFAANQSNGIKYTTVWDGNAALSNDTLYGLCAATTHTCVITDKNGCTATYTVTVPPAPLPITFTQTNNSPLNCRNVCNGALSVNTVAGGTAPYTFSWTPVLTPTNTANSSGVSGLCAGSYTNTIKDANGCTVSATFTITSPPALSHTLTVINPKCNGQFSGSIKDSVSGGTPAGTSPQYTFSWTPAGTITGTTSSSTNSNLGPGSYSVVATDSKGCKDTARATLINPPAITATLTPTNPSCFGSANGQLCVAASGGTGSVYTYSWTPAEPPTACVSGLSAGSYSVIVSDSNNCKKTVSGVLVAPPQINISVVKINPTCSNLCNGTATVTASGGTGGYTYSWSCAAGNTTPVLSGQCGGTSCTVTVTDANGCTQKKTISFINPNPLSVSISATSLVCANQCNAQITSNVTGGTPTYTYSWSGTGANPVCVTCPNQTNMCAGSYSLIVTDSNNCTANANISVSAPNPLVVTATPTNPTCFGNCDGSIAGVISGGSIPYTFGWSPAIVPNTLTPNNLCAGSYTLNVIDANGCTATQSVTLISPPVVTASVTSTNVTCAGSCNGTATVTAAGGTAPYLYSWDGAAYTASTSTLNLCAGTHTLVVKDSKSCGSASVIYTITQPQALTASVSNITKSCLNICNGTASASASGGTPGYTYSWDAAAGPFSNVTNTNTLCIGTHTLYVKDANGCIASTVFNVQVIINVNILANSLSVSCHDVCDGSASATASGGSGPYTFSWTPTPTPVPNCTNVNSCTATNLCPGPYKVLVTDQTGCASEDSLTILNPPVLAASVAVTPATCFGVCNGSATVTPTGGTAPYTEQWSNNGIIGTTPSGLCPGSYTATVTDNRGCTVTNPVVVTSPSQFTVTPTITSPVACLSSTGSISLAISGGTSGYTINWSNPPGGSSNPLTNVAAGIYTVTVTDTKGCDTSLAIGVSDPTGPTTTTVVNNNASCYGSCNGSATVSGVGVNPITVTWTGGTPSGPSPITDNALCAGFYPVKVSDGNGCISIANITITQPTKINDGAIVSPLTCSSGNTGSITLNPSGGCGFGYTFNVDGGASSSNPVLGLSAGSHTVVITDGCSCSQTFTYNIASPTALVINVTKTNELCAGACNGTAQATVTGGTAAYTYTWTNSSGVVSNNPNVAGLCPGTYTLNITDAHNCSGQAIITINAANPILPNLVQQNNNCNTGCTGAATVTPTGGAGGTYTYNWNTPGNPSGTSVSGVCPGNYFVTITDTNLCAITTTFTLTAPPTVTASVVYTRPACFGGTTGAATVTPSGGTPTYTVTWSPLICIGCVTTNSLSAGFYTTNVIDSKGCTGSVSFTITDTTKLNANAVGTNPLCNNNCNGSILSSPIGGNGGYIYQWQGIVPPPAGPSATNLCPGTYTLIVVDNKSCRDTAYVTLTNPPKITLTESQSAATCGQNNGSVTISTVTPSGTLAVNWLSGSCGTSPTCSNLAAGIYSVTLTNINNCKDTFLIGITNSNGPLAVATSTNVSCAGSCNGAASVTNVTGNGAFTYTWSPAVTFTSTATSSTASGLCSTSPGPTYISTITDVLSCKTLTTFSISSPPPITDNPNIINATCAGINNGSITSNGSGGTPFVSGYLYSLDGGPYSSTHIFNGLAVGSHTVCIKDSLGCSDCFIYNIQGSTIIISSLTSTNNNCFGVCNATATLSNVNGGAPPYIITWNDPNGQAGPLAVNLCAGTYTATITDTMGCKATQVATITAPSTSVSPNYSVTPPSCGLCNGAIALAPAGGNGGVYTYTWSTSNTTANLSNVCAGLYQVDIDDAAGCKTTFQIPVSNSNAPTASIASTNIACGGVLCNGSATVTASGGTLPYTYNWVSPPASTPTISNLCAGTYFVQIKDAANCVQTQSVTITAPTPIVLNQTVTPTDCGKCNGAVTVAPTGGSGSYTYTWNGVASTATQANLCAGSYTLVVSDGTCSQTSFININSSNAPVVSVAVSNPTCSGLSTGSATATILGGVPPVSTSWSNGSSSNPDVGLSAGIYNLVVTDNNGCASVQTFTITSPTPIALSLNNTQLPSCSNVCNGLLTAIPSGGTLPYTYTWSPVPSNQDTIGHLCAGSYTVNVTDANGCAISQISTLINNPFLINPNTTVVQPSCAQCNGTITLNPTGGNGAYTYTWTTTPVNNTNQQTNVCPGVYQVDITDNIGCTQNVQIPVSSSNSPTITVSTSSITCNGLSNGSATATATGGILPYVFSWPSIPANGSTVSGLNVGIYVVQVKDSAGCIATQSVSIAEPAALNANATMTAPTSCTVCDGSISTAVTGGSGAYTYTWSANAGSVNTPTVGNLCAGIYTLTIGDGACRDTLTMGLNSPSGPTLTIAATDEKCFGVCNGSATVTATGGATPYTYTWIPNGGNGAIASGLCATLSPFMVEVADQLNCIQTISVTINEPTKLLASLPTITEPKCLNNTNGAINTVISGGTPAYTYSWNPSSLTGPNPQNLGAGVYTYTVTDANGCSITQSATLVNNPFTINPNATITQPTCAQCNGTILLNPSGGTGAYSYTWTTSPISHANPQTNVCAGIYQVDITDAIGCQQTVQIPVSSSNSPSVTVNATNVTCSGLSNGSATATATGGILPYIFSWPSVPSFGPIVSGLNATTIYVQVKDSAGCIATQSVTITEPTPLNPNATMTSPTSCTVCDGSITTAVTGGSGSYTYTWSANAGGVNTPGASNLCAGIYTLVVSDGSCSNTSTFGLNSPAGPSLTIAFTDEKCFGDCNGTATVTATGGTPSYIYSWTPNGGSGPIATNLCINNYFVSVTDNAGCIQTQSVTINQPSKLITSLPTITPIKCANDVNGAINTVVSGGIPTYTYAWNPSVATGNNPQNLPAGIYSLTVTDANGCTNINETDTLKNPAPLHLTGTTMPASCNNTPDGSITTNTSGGTPGYTWLWSNNAVTANLSSILPGTYSVMATDAHGCMFDTNFTVISTITITVNAGRDTSLCTNASVVLTGTVTGSSTFDWYTGGVAIPPANSLTVSVNPATTTQYILTATNSGCTNSDTVVVSISPLAVANAGADQSILSGQGVTIGGNPTNPGGGAVVWMPNVALSDTSATNPTASPTLTTTYIVVVTNASGCIAKDTMVVTVLPPFDIPNGFTPNGDSKNDTWMLDNLYKFPNAEVEVYNRWGEQLFYSRGNYQAWNGNYNGSPVPVGTYYYIIKLNDKNYPDHYAGPLTILR